jgi:hypothetical protein
MAVWTHGPKVPGRDNIAWSAISSKLLQMVNVYNALRLRPIDIDERHGANEAARSVMPNALLSR